MFKEKDYDNENDVAIMVDHEQNIPKVEKNSTVSTNTNAFSYLFLRYIHCMLV